MNDMIERCAKAMFDCYTGYDAETRKLLFSQAKYQLERQAERAYAALTPADLATLAEGMGLAVVPINVMDKSTWHTLYDYGVEHDAVENCFRDLLAASRIKPGQEGGGDDQE